MNYRKKLIEVALPLEAINIASAREKSIRHGHPSTLHLWWARRPLAACRAVIFASLVDDPDDPDAPPEFVQECMALKDEYGTNPDNDTPRQRLFKFIETLVQWESTTNERVLEKARELIRLATGGNPPPLLDPFAGGGSIPLEAQRLGLEAHASDLNPVAVMINKALIEIPPKFANMPPVNPRDRQGTAGNGGWKGAAGLAADVRFYGEWMRQQAWEKIGQLYPQHNNENVIAWIWARTVKSPNPVVEIDVPLIASYWLSRRKGQEAYIEPVVSGQNYWFEVRKGKPSDRRMVDSGTKVGRGGNFRCILSGVPIGEAYIKNEARSGRLGARLVAIVTEGNGGRNFYPATQEHEEVARRTQPKWVPEQAINYSPRDIRPQLYGMLTYADLFTPRQLVALTTFTDLVSEAARQIESDAESIGLPKDRTPLRENGTGARAYAEAVVVYLALGISKASDLASALCRWQSNAEHLKLAPTYARHALAMNWDYAEGNPFSDSSGNFHRQYELIAEVLNNLNPCQSAIAIQQDARSATLGIPEGTLVSTDPPYYDNINYADLSDYFYIWLRMCLRPIYPEIFSTLLVPKSSELVAAPHRFEGDSDAAQEFFETGLRTVFSNLCTASDTDYPLTIYYAFKQSESEINEDGEGESSISSTGWETMLEAVVQAGFAITGTWPMRTERSGGLRNLNQNALASSIVLVCRSRTENVSLTTRAEFIKLLRAELPAALRDMQSGNIAPVDLAQASIGPGMAVYSRYSQVLEPNGERLTVRTALQVINQVLDEYLAEQEGDLDADSRFAVAWFEQFGFDTAEFGRADVLARAKNTSVEGLAHAGVLKSGAGKVQLYHWSELDAGWDPSTDKRVTTWEATHHLIERLNTHGESGAAMLLAKMQPELAASARQLAYRLYAICERKGWAEIARDYNALVISWGASQEQAAQLREQYQQGKLF